MKILSLLTVFFLSLSSAAVAQEQTLLFFICDTEEQAKEVAINLQVSGTHAVPAGCRWLGGKGVETQGALINEIVQEFASYGAMIEIGHVTTAQSITGYSAGLKPMLLF